MANYVTSVGMEVHAELLTRSKMFCGCEAAYGGQPNTRVCPVCLALPGALPVPNRAAIEFVIRTALALNCKIAMRSVFHRKNYFYPDIPKGYQISQYGDFNPLGYDGYLEIPAEGGAWKRVKIRRVHLEEDTGKLTHLPGGGSGVDYNRAGVPLMEIVTDFPPDIHNPEEAKEYLAQLRQILVFLGVCDGRMEHGSMRCEPNISIRLADATDYGTKTELKNLNSFRSVQLGVAFETRRQAAVIDAGGSVVQETRGWNEGSESSYLMRVKESENDYRYFEDPDLIPMVFDESYISSLREALPELPLAKFKRYVEDFGLSEYDANLLISSKPWSVFFEACVALGGAPKAICNWMNSDFAKRLNETSQTVAENDEEQTTSRVTPAHLVELAQLIEDGTISGKIAKSLFADVFESGEMPRKLVASQGLTQVTDRDAILLLVNEAIADNPDPVANYRAGQANALGFLVGQIMKQTGGRANPALVNELLKERLKT